MDYKMIYDLLKELRVDVKDVKNEQKSHGEELIRQSVCLNNLEKDVHRNTNNVEIHMKRTDAVEESLFLLRELHQDNQKKIGTSEDKIDHNKKRIDSLEEPRKVRGLLKKYYLGMIGIISAMTGTTYAIIKIIDYFK